MDFGFDESKILYALGAFLGVVSILYFGHELILNLSPTIKSFVFLSATAIFISGADLVKNSILRSSLYIFSTFSYLSFLGYLFARFSLSSEQVFLVLAASSAAFIGLGYLRSEKDFKLTGEKAKKVIGSVIILLTALIIFDAVGSQPEYSLELKDEVEVIEGEAFKVGTLKVSNDFVFSRNLDMPRYEGCLVVSENKEPKPLYISPDDEVLIHGLSSETYNLTEKVRSRPDDNMTISGTYTVKQEKCPDELENRTIYLSADDDGRGLIVSRDLD